MITEKRILLILLVFLLIQTSNVFAWEFTKERIDKEDFFLDLYVDNTLKIYLSSDSGLFFYNGEKTFKISENPIMGFTSKNRKLYLASPDGIYEAEGGTAYQICPEYGYGLENFKDRLYFFNEKGLFFLDDSFSIHTLENFSNILIDRIVASGDYLFISSSKGVSLFDGNDIITLNESKDIRVLDVQYFKDKYYIFSTDRLYVLDEEKKLTSIMDMPFEALDTAKSEEEIFVLSEKTLFYFDGEKLLPFFDESKDVELDKPLQRFELFDYAGKRNIFLLSGDGDVYHYMSFLDEEKDEFNTLFNKASKLYYDSLFDKSINILMALYRKDPDDPKVNLLLGRNYREKMEYEKAQKYYSAAFRKEPSSEIIGEFAALAVYRGDLEFAHDLYIKLNKESGGSLNSYIRIIENLEALKQYNEALYYVEEAERHLGKKSVLSSHKIEMLKKTWQYDKLEVLFKELVMDEREDPHFVLSYIDFLIENFRFRDASRYIKMAYERFKTRYEYDILIREIKLLLEQKNLGQAEEVIHYANTKYPSEIFLKVLNAYYYLKMNNWGMSEKYIYAVEKQGYVQDWLLLYIKGLLAYYDKKYQDSMYLLEESVNLNPVFPYSRFYLAEMFIRQKFRFSASRQYKIILENWPKFEYYEQVYKRYNQLD